MIENGSNWRRTLNRMLARADVVLSIADGQTIGRPWPDAELAAALRAHARSGRPEIVVLAHPNLSPDDVARAQPAFRRALETCKDWRSPRVVMAGPDAVKGQVAMARHHFRLSKALLDPDEARLIGVVTFPLLTAGVLLASWSTLTGWVAIALTALDLLPVDVDWVRIPGTAIVRPLGCAACYWAGALARLTTASRFDFDRTYRLGSYRLHLGMAGCLAWVAVRLLSPLAGVAWLWGVIAVGAGWLMADVFTGTVRKERPDLVRQLPD